MANAIITGGAGFVASHLADAIAEKYDKVYLVDNLVRTENLRNIEHLPKDKFIFIKADVATFDFASIEASAIYHLAAIRINRCTQYPEEGHSFLADGGFNVVRHCAEYGRKLFFSSTASVYNNPKRFPIQETDPCEPHTLYGAAKYYTENLIRSFAKSHDLKYTICRFFSIYGERMDCEGAYTEVIFNWLNAISKGQRQITVFGNPDEKVLDLVYVKDIVKAILKATESWDNETYNVSTETGVTMAHLIKTIEEVTEVTLDINVKADSRTDIEKKRVGCVEKLRMLGWKPSYDLINGIKETYTWISSLNGQSLKTK